MVPGASGKFCSCCINNKAFCGLRLNAIYFLVFAFLHCLFLAPSVHRTQLLLGGDNPTCFAMYFVLWLGKQRKGTAHLVTSPGRCQGGTPAWEVPVGRRFVCSSCVHRGQLGLQRNRCQGLCRAHLMVSLEQLSPLSMATRLCPLDAISTQEPVWTKHFPWPGAVLRVLPFHRSAP